MLHEVMVIKCGGSMLEQLPESFYNKLATLQAEGRSIVIVHGGGPAINQMLEQLKIEPTFSNGLRVTDEPTMQAVEMVLSGPINKLVVRKLLHAGGKAWGLSGVDGSLLQAVEKTQGLGLVGNITVVDQAPLQLLLSNGYIPVVSPIAVSEDGRTRYNCNADTVAGAIASALGAKQLLMLTDVPGIWAENELGEKQLLPTVTTEDIQLMMKNQIITGGMIPKVQAALDALAQGVQEVVICKGEAETLDGVVKGMAVGTSISAEMSRGQDSQAFISNKV
ncbi:acetylglutamate kinase [Brevibacillus laterosporus]|uniref:acetylglutamate kinase n=1 Tax=Brevibacillus laterosporus TaxID=1465 RepID=UPI00036E1661|nr:acetylglutamate kinase [Brevibacillus laterosporus]ATO49103.1 acetylglutamate kinase [Brevibacillus laterosporus DSM 25]MBG9803649.1 acetylglutamate kinase [Brevibacillus laterosporus]MED2003603.1 acetylglutamate kinase [Brevibacillus laterosporus]MED4763219.1 acetylglutamate kinase [Brevibacillus laterosporus]TPH19881.1 acetylglutamate kinase [Brevibacillus laterosporus]